MLAVGYSDRRVAAPDCVTDGGGWAEIWNARSADMLGDLVVEMAAHRYAEPGDLCPATRTARRPSDALFCRIERVADKHAYALRGILVRGIERRHLE
jgi:hypothetical protein